MAQVRITASDEDGATLEVEVEVEGSYPDAVAEARANTLALWRELCDHAEDTEDE